MHSQNKANPHGIPVAEDDPLLLDVTAELLEINNSTIHKARTVKQALEIMEFHAPAWAVLDFNLADGDGLQIIEFAKQKEYCLIKFVAISGLITTQGRAGEFLRIADYSFQKPVDWDQLVALVDREYQQDQRRLVLHKTFGNRSTLAVEMKRFRCEPFS